MESSATTMLLKRAIRECLISGGFLRWLDRSILFLILQILAMTFTLFSLHHHLRPEYLLSAQEANIMTTEEAEAQEEKGRWKLTYLYVLQAVLLAYAPQNVFLAAFLHFTRQQQLIEYEVGLLEVEDDIQLAHIPVVLVHLLDISMDDLKGDEFVVG